MERVHKINNIQSVSAGIYRTQILSQIFLDFTSVWGCVCGGGQTCKQGKIKLFKKLTAHNQDIKNKFLGRYTPVQEL